jgi:hypothetical protein
VADGRETAGKQPIAGLGLAHGCQVTVSNLRRRKPTDLQSIPGVCG